MPYSAPAAGLAKAAVVASGQRQVIDALLIDGLADLHAGSVHHLRVGLHFDDLANGTDLQDETDARVLVDFDDAAGAALQFESAGFGLQGVFP